MFRVRGAALSITFARSTLATRGARAMSRKVAGDG